MSKQLEAKLPLKRQKLPTDQGSGRAAICHGQEGWEEWEERKEEHRENVSTSSTNVTFSQTKNYSRKCRAGQLFLLYNYKCSKHIFLAHDTN